MGNDDRPIASGGKIGIIFLFFFPIDKSSGSPDSTQKSLLNQSFDDPFHSNGGNVKLPAQLLLIRDFFSELPVPGTDLLPQNIGNFLMPCSKSGFVLHKNSCAILKIIYTVINILSNPQTFMR
jgi:hypothetical protein